MQVLLAWAEHEYVQRVAVPVGEGRQLGNVKLMLPPVLRGATVTPPVPWLRLDEPEYTDDGAILGIGGTLPNSDIPPRVVVDHLTHGGGIARVILIFNHTDGSE